jgi:hypothetical protein
MNVFTIIYEFTLPNGASECFELCFDSATIQLIGTHRAEPPFWAKMSYEQCSHCLFHPDLYPDCPVAVNLVPAIARFDKLMSFDKISVAVTSAERRVVQSTSAQEGLSSLMGLLIAGSSCPYTHFFKPMARFHLPFANKDETMWRAAATFMLARYFSKEGLTTSDMLMQGLVTIYNDVARLNDALIQRLRAATCRDSAVNALVHLDVFAKFLIPPLEDSLMQIKSIFDPYLDSLQE